jgi:hypothetical protein
MAYPTYVSGKIGYVAVVDSDGNGTGDEWDFDEWEYDPSAKILPRNNFTSGGINRNIGGFVGAELTLSGFMATDEPVTLTVGEVYTFLLGIDPDSPLEFQLDARVESVRITNKAEDGARWVVKAMSTGDFEPSIPQQFT